MWVAQQRKYAACCLSPEYISPLDVMQAQKIRYLHVERHLLPNIILFAFQIIKFFLILAYTYKRIIITECSILVTYVLFNSNIVKVMQNMFKVNEVINWLYKVQQFFH